MTWIIDGPQGNESAKIKHLIVRYTRGRGVDLGCGPYKAYPHFIGVDNLHHAKAFGWSAEGVDVASDCTDLDMFADSSLNFVYSSHLLEHIKDTVATLREWWRVIGTGGYLVLYLPHKKFYPNVGQPGSNPDHKHDFMPEDIIGAMEQAGKSGWELVENEDRNQGDEYSFYQVYKKTSDHKFVEKPWRKKTKNALVIRYGAFGDQIMASSCLPGLKDQGYHVTYQTTPVGHDIMWTNPHIDDFWIQDKDQVPNQWLSVYFERLNERYDRIVNLCESVEGGLLAMPGRVQYHWPLAARQKLLGKNYLEHTHDIAGVPHVFDARFWPTEKERKRANRLHKELGPTVLISLAGSSVHKVWPYGDVLTSWLMNESDLSLVLVGGPECVEMEDSILAQLLTTQGFNKDQVFGKMTARDIRKEVKKIYGDRLQCRSGEWSIRQSFAFSQVADVVVGPETGVLNAAGMEQNAKIIFLSHSSEENLTKHWVNTAALTTPVECYPCHRLHYNRDYCPQDEETGASVCAAAIAPETVFRAIVDAVKQRKAA